MRTTVYLCDLCAAEGEVSLGKWLYEGSGKGLWVACEGHINDVIDNDLLVVKEFELPGGVNPDLVQE